MKAVHNSEQGSVLIFVAISLTIFFLTLAFIIDLGLMYKTQTELQTTADAAALAGAARLVSESGGAPNLTDVRDKAQSFAGYNQLSIDRNNENVTEGGIVVGTIPNPAGGIDESNQFTATTTNPNSVQVEVKRSESLNGPLALFFGAYTGYTQVSLAAKATASIQSSRLIGFDAPQGDNLDMLPFTCYDTVWAAATDGSGDTDAYRVVNGTVTSGSDGIPEITFRPETSTSGGLIFVMGTVSAGNVNTQIISGMTQANINAIGGLTMTVGTNGYYRQWIPGENYVDSNWITTIKNNKGKRRILAICKRVNVGTTKPISLGKPSEAGPQNQTETCCAIDRYFEIVRYEGVTMVDGKTSTSPYKVIVQPAELTVTPDVGKIASDGPPSNNLYSMALTR